MTKKADTDTAASTDALAAGKAHPIDFESIRHVNPYGMEYWSARELAPLLGYTKWERFEGAIKRATTACAQVGGIVGDHFPPTQRMVRLGSGAERALTDYALSRLACYLIAENGDPRKPEIAQAQVYFVVSTRQNELQQLGEQRDERIRLRERVSENNKKLAEAAHGAGVLSRSFGVFQNAGYRGLYGGLDLGAIKVRKGIGAREDLLDRSGRAELAANDFRITQTEERLRKEGIIGQTKAMDTHHEVGQTVRRAIEEIGGTMPEDLPPEHSIKPVIEARRRGRKKTEISQEPVSDTEPQQRSLFD